jgi:hypothetical protein
MHEFVHCQWCWLKIDNPGSGNFTYPSGHTNMSWHLLECKGLEVLIKALTKPKEDNGNRIPFLDGDRK